MIFVKCSVKTDCYSLKKTFLKVFCTVNSHYNKVSVVGSVI